MQTDNTPVNAATVGCDGGGGALGHPLVYLTFDQTGRIECPYCSRVFVRASGTNHPATK